MYTDDLQESKADAESKTALTHLRYTERVSKHPRCPYQGQNLGTHQGLTPGDYSEAELWDGVVWIPVNHLTTTEGLLMHSDSTLLHCVRLHVQRS